MHMVWHNFHLNNLDAVFIADFRYESIQMHINAIVQDLAAIFWAPDHMIFAGVRHTVVALMFHNNATLPFSVSYKTIRSLTGK